MKNLKINLSIVAIIMASAAAFATKPSSLAPVTYVNVGGAGSSSNWEATNRVQSNSAPFAPNSFRCEQDDSQACSITQDESLPAPANGSNPSSAQLGDYVPND